MKTTITCLILSGLLMGASLPAGLTPEEKGRWIALEMEDRIFDHYGDSSFETTLIITDDDGDVYRRHMRSKILEVPGEGDKLLGIFDSPADIKGFATLTVTHKYEPDDLWIYLPEIRRVKRGTSQNKGGDFMGSEWQMEDMARQEPEKFTYRWLREEEMDGMVCHVIERYPKEKSIYSKQVQWIDQDHYRLHKMEYYDKEGKHVKTLTFHGYQLYEDQFWRWDENVMTDHETGAHTRMVFDNWKFNTGLTDDDFSINGLKRIR